MRQRCHTILYRFAAHAWRAALQTKVHFGRHPLGQSSARSFWLIVFPASPSPRSQEARERPAMPPQLLAAAAAFRLRQCELCRRTRRSNACSVGIWATCARPFATRPSASSLKSPRFEGRSARGEGGGVDRNGAKRQAGLGSAARRSLPRRSRSGPAHSEVADEERHQRVNRAFLQALDERARRVTADALAATEAARKEAVDAAAAGRQAQTQRGKRRQRTGAVRLRGARPIFLRTAPECPTSLRSAPLCRCVPCEFGFSSKIGPPHNC